MDNNNQQITQTESGLSRFPDDFIDADLDDEILSTTSPLIASKSSTEQTNTNKKQAATSYTDNKKRESDQTKGLSRWDTAWDEHEKQQQQQEINEILSKDEKMKENVDIPNTHPINTPSSEIVRIYVREFLPQSARDPTFSILRHLFVRSFDDFYKQIETQLNLKSNKNLVQWLDETFDEEQEAILSKKYRCFLLCGQESQGSNEIILGFLTLREEEGGSIYIAQVAVRLDVKRRGCGAQLLQHLRNIYPPNTFYWGLCRRANRPALQFYLKHGAKFMNDDEIATKYKYDPALYAGFEFVDTVPVIGSPVSSLGKSKPKTGKSKQQPITLTHAAQNPGTAIDGQQGVGPLKLKRKKVVGCCIIS